MKILVINGPNLNMLGIREPDVYGKQDFRTLEKFIKSSASELGHSVQEESLALCCPESNLSPPLCPQRPRGILHWLGPGVGANSSSHGQDAH